MRRLVLILCVSLSLVCDTTAQSGNKRVLFLGNSYTYVNDLPGMLGIICSTTGDTLQASSNTIGGYRLQDHAYNTNSLSLIQQGSWDMVVLQEQSQLPSFPDGQVAEEVYPYAKLLDSLIHQANPCTNTMFYMTWGRKNGDASNCPTWPPVCTYVGMDSLLHLRYVEMARQNHATVSPVGAVWRYLRQMYPSFELYDADQSHPSSWGTYAAACTFYTSIFKKDPTQIRYWFNADSANSNRILNACKTVVFDSLSKWDYRPHPEASFTSQINGRTVSFTNKTDTTMMVKWDFGDGQTSDEIHPVHTYGTDGNFNVIMHVSQCNETDTASSMISLKTTGIRESFEAPAIQIYPNPSHGYFQIKGFEGTGMATVYDLTGNEIFSKAINEKDIAVETEGFAEGIYLLRLKGQTHDHYWRILVQKP